MSETALYPGSLDTFVKNFVDGDDMGDETPGSTNEGPHSAHHNKLGDAVEKLEIAIGTSAAPKFVSRAPASAAENTITSPDGVVSLTLKPDKNDYPIDVFYQPSESFPRFRIGGQGALVYGDGSSAPDPALRGLLYAGINGFQMFTPAGKGLSIFQDAAGKALDGGGAAGNNVRLDLRGGPKNGINGTRADTPLSDVANGPDHSSFDLLSLRNYGGDTPTTGHDTRGSYHQIVGNLEVHPYVGNGSGGALTTPFGNAGTDVFTKTAHGLAAGDPIQFTALTGGAGLATLTPYFVIASGLTADEFKLSATLGGGSVNFTSNITAGTFERIAYTEGFWAFSRINAKRKGSLIGTQEHILEIFAGSPGRITGSRQIMIENNPVGDYNAANLGAGSTYIGGATAFEALSQGTQRTGIGFKVQGNPGFEYMFLGKNAAGGVVSGIDGNGGVITRTKAGVPVDGDFRQPQDGLLVVDTTNNRIYARCGGTWKQVTIA